MTDFWTITLTIAILTFAIRMTGVFLGQKLPESGPWARALNALPGCLIIALVTLLLLSGSMPEWIAAGFALATALVTRNLPLTMVAGIVSVALLRYL